VRASIELLRVRHWTKNVFVLAPLFFGADLFDSELVIRSLAACGVFCLVSSAVYIFNDWRDLDADRHHSKKCSRPLPSGRICVSRAIFTMIALLLTSAALTFLADLPRTFVVLVAAYIVANLLYSLGVKSIAVLELAFVASGFVFRLLAGGAAIGVPLSPWIIVATGTIASMLAVGKRRGDIARSNDLKCHRKSLQHYNLQFLDSLLSVLVASTLVIYVLFCVSAYATARYTSYVLCTTVPVAIGLLRYLQLVMVKNDGDAPTDLVLKDPGIMLSVLIFIGIFGGLIYLQ